MKWRIVIGNLGTILRLFSLTLLVPAVLSVVFEPRTTEVLLGLHVAPTTLPFLSVFAGTWLTGFLLERVGLRTEFRDTEAYILVGIGWISCTVVAALPYLATGVLLSPIDAFFEAMSGLTTTGATIMAPPLEEIPAGVHVWRAQTQWLGGMGIVVLTVAVLSRLASAGARLMQAELPGGKVQRVKPSIIQTARALWSVYVGLSAVLFITLLLLLHQELGSWSAASLDAIVHTFTTMSTGGFSTRSVSIETYQAPVIEGVILIFMIIAGTNFALSYRALLGRVGALTDDPEFRFFITVLAVGTGLVVAALLFAPDTAEFWAYYGDKGILSAVRAASFQVVSIVTTTGYSTANYDAFPEVARFLMLFMMFVGGCAGSTGGSIKVVRVLVMFRVLKAEIKRIAHPRAVLPIRLGREILGSQAVQRVMVFIFAYLTLFLGGTLVILAIEPLSILDSASAVAASIGNIGPALGMLGPHENYAIFSGPSKLLLSLLMWVGRLELFAVLVLFSPDTYR